MRPYKTEPALVVLLRQYYTTSRCQTTRSCRRIPLESYARSYSSQTRNKRPNTERKYHNQASFNSGFIPRTREVPHKPNAEALEKWSTNSDANIAVLGGGITGLATAYYLTKSVPGLKVTIYEGSERLGGWLHTKYIDVGDGQVVFEQGPRTLRPKTPAGMVTTNLVRDLGLQDSVLATDKNSVAAQNRFIYYPDHLVRMPGPGQDPFNTVWSMLTEDVFTGLWEAAFEYRRPTRPSGLEDESVGSFLNRRLGGPHIGNNLVSAVLHGIYAGDIYKLSARSLLPSLWFYEKRFGTLTNSFLTTMNKKYMPISDIDLIARETSETTIKETVYWWGMSVYTFKGGLGTLAETLNASLRTNPNVTIKLGHQIKSIDYDSKDDNIKIQTANGESTSHYKAISTLSGRTLSNLASDARSLPSLAKTESVTVMVVNLYFRDEHLLPERGFGYLIPRSIPFEQNPEFALGVVFDTDSTIGQDNVKGTKLTVMLGGHWWDNFDTYPDEEEGAAMAKAVLKRHLKILDEPEMVNVTLQKDCIPQYTVGHGSRMRTTHYDLMALYKGKLTVAGNSYTGVGVNDCIRAAKDVALEIASHKDVTGLEGFLKEEGYGVMPP